MECPQCKIEMIKGYRVDEAGVPLKEFYSWLCTSCNWVAPKFIEQLLKGE